MADEKKKQTVIVVEDEKLILASYTDILDAAGYETIGCPDGSVGLEKASANKDKIDLMLLDLMMPGVDGLMVLDAIQKDKEKYGEYPIVVLTNLSSETVIKEAFSRGATGYIMKTELQPENLVSEVEKFIK